MNDIFEDIRKASEPVPAYFCLRNNRGTKGCDDAIETQLGMVCPHSHHATSGQCGVMTPSTHQ